MRKLPAVAVIIVIVIVAIYYYRNSDAIIELSGGINTSIDYALLSAPVDVSEYGGGSLQLRDGRGTITASSLPGHVVADVVLGKPRAIIVKGEDADVYALMHVNGGGTGTFQYLVRYEYIGATRSVIEVEKVLLGDRITVSSITTEPVSPDEYIVAVSIKDRKAGESLAVAPSEARVLHFTLKSGALKFSAITFGTLTENDAVLTSPLPNAEVNSLFTVQGAARGPWYFEASFPIELRAMDGVVLANAIAQAEGEWTTSELVPFTATMVAPNTAHGRHIIVLKKDNPSGLPENDKSIEIPVVLK